MSKIMGGRLWFGQHFGDPRKGVVFGSHHNTRTSFGATTTDSGSAALPDQTLTPRTGALRRGWSRKTGPISELRKCRPRTHKNSRRRDVQNHGGRLWFGQHFGEPEKGVVFGSHHNTGTSFGATTTDSGSAAQPDPTLTPRNGALKRGWSRKTGPISELRKRRNSARREYLHASPHSHRRGLQ